jgi:UDP-N-acetylmuramoyl-tripeptide--D-alanyl-D-alanine ligase
MSVAAGVFAIVAVLVGSVRWLRIAQREHYIPGSVTRFAFRWWLSRSWNIGLFAALVAGAIAGIAGYWEGTTAAAVISLGAPAGLSYRGRSAKLAWTRRLKVLAAITLLLVAVAAAAAGLGGVLPQVAAVMVVFAPIISDVALGVTAPLERRVNERFVRAARKRLASVTPRVVAITGSYGKTSTKLYAGHLLREKYVTLTSPASFNNKTGLSRTINERLAPGTEVFVAEMGTYGKGEIRAMCDWVRPEVSVITAIGSAHLERMRTLDNIAAAKAEIVETAEVAVLNIDDPRLAAVGATYEAGGGKLIRCSTSDEAADVYVASDGGTISIGGHSLGSAELLGAFPGNLACAIGVAVAMEIPELDIAARLATLPRPDHRQTIETTDNGIVVIDDTYNSNPQGSDGALDTLRSVGAGHRMVVVTPGMVELGSHQAPANEEFARRASRVVTDLLIIGRTNRRSLLRGAQGGSAAIKVCERRSDAVSWIRANLGTGDAVLYENDLPDHYP